MSWLPKNYDKVALGAAAVVALAVGYSVFSGGNEVPAPKPANPDNTVAIEEREILEQAEQRFSADYEIPTIESEGIEVHSFVSFPLYSIKGTEGIQSLTDDYPIHPGMPLKWWKQYDLKDYTKSDGPELDADNDGFTNREEHDGKTDPTDGKKHPDLIAKLRSTGAEGVPYSMNWTKISPEKGNFLFNYGINRRKNRFYGGLGVGDKFPPEADDQSLIGRFEILEKGQDPDDDGDDGDDGEYYVIQDNGEFQNKKTFKLYYRKKLEMRDWSATFLLDIPDAGPPFTVPEGGSFSLPYDKDAKSKPYKFKSKKDNQAEIEYEVEGKKLTDELEIPPTKQDPK
jgi:hypothetical protein